MQATLNPGVTIRNFQQALNQAHSWYRVTPTSWLICSPDEDADIWVERLTVLTRPGGALFISALNVTDYRGWMPHEFWIWWNNHQAH